MVQAYILIQTEVGKSATVAQAIREVAGVASAEDVTGPYDVIARVKAESVDDRGKRVICAGLDQDFRGLPFGAMPELLARAEDVSKLHAICVICGEDASRTQRLIEGQPAAFDDPVVLVGAAEVYEARCRKCHQIAPSSIRKGGYGEP